MNHHASYVSVAEFGGLTFHASVDAEDLDACFDLPAPGQPRFLI